MALIHNKKQTLTFQSDCVHIINPRLFINSFMENDS